VVGEQDFWELRFDLERSKAIKLPSIDAQLMTLKKFQEAFNSKSLLEELMQNHPEREQSIAILEPAFQGIYSLEHLDDPTT